MRIVTLKLALLALLGCVFACSDDDPGARARPNVGPISDWDAGPGGLCASCGGCEEHQDNASRLHVTGPVDYPDPPPTGGMHDQCWGAWGVHDSALAPEHWVHNLEHGGVVLLYHCDDGCSAEVARMKTFVATHARTLLTSYAELPKRFAVVAWGYRLVSDCLDDAALGRFYAQHVDRGPESIADGPPTICLERPDL